MNIPRSRESSRFTITDSSHDNLNPLTSSFEYCPPMFKLKHDRNISFDQYIAKKLTQLQKPKNTHDSQSFKRLIRLSQHSFDLDQIPSFQLPINQEDSGESDSSSSSTSKKSSKEESFNAYNSIHNDHITMDKFEITKDSTTNDVIGETYTTNLLFKEYYKKIYSTEQRGKSMHVNQRNDKRPAFRRIRTFINNDEDLLTSPFKNELLKHNLINQHKESNEIKKSKNFQEEKSLTRSIQTSEENTLVKYTENNTMGSYQKTSNTPLAQKENRNLATENEIYMRLKDQMRSFDTKSGKVSKSRIRPQSVNYPRKRGEHANLSLSNSIAADSIQFPEKCIMTDATPISNTNHNDPKLLTNPTIRMNTGTSEITQIINEDQLFPEWIRKHNEFQQVYSKKKRGVPSVIPDICMKESQYRNEEDKKLVVNWLKKLSLFRIMPYPMVKEIASRCSTRIYQPGEYICHQGEAAHSLYVIYDGLIDVIVNGKIENQCKPLEVIGKMALEYSGFRQATLVAIKETTLLVIMKNDYESIILSFIQSERNEYVNFVKSIKIFNNVTQKKLYFLNNNVFGRFYIKGETLYNKGDIAENFYIVKEGAIRLEADIDVERENIWPLGKGQWQKKKIIRTVVYKKIIKDGSYFGELEIIRDLRRANRAIAHEDSYVLFIHKSKFYDIFDRDDIKKLNSNTQKNSLIDIESMKKEITKEEKEQKSLHNSLAIAISKNIKPLANPNEIPKSNSIINQLQEKVKKRLKESTCKVNKKEEIVDRVIEL